VLKIKIILRVLFVAAVSVRQIVKLALLLFKIPHVVECPRAFKWSRILIFAVIAEKLLLIFLCSDRLHGLGFAQPTSRQTWRLYASQVVLEDIRRNLNWTLYALNGPPEHITWSKIILNIVCQEILRVILFWHLNIPVTVETNCICRISITVNRHKETTIFASAFFIDSSCISKWRAICI